MVVLLLIGRRPALRPIGIFRELDGGISEKLVGRRPIERLSSLHLHTKAPEPYRRHFSPRHQSIEWLREGFHMSQLKKLESPVWNYLQSGTGWCPRSSNKGCGHPINTSIREGAFIGRGSHTCAEQTVEERYQPSRLTSNHYIGQSVC